MCALVCYYLHCRYFFCSNLALPSLGWIDSFQLLFPWWPTTFSDNGTSLDDTRQMTQRIRSDFLGTAVNTNYNHLDNFVAYVCSLILLKIFNWFYLWKFGRHPWRNKKSILTWFGLSVMRKYCLFAPSKFVTLRLINIISLEWILNSWIWTVDFALRAHLLTLPLLKQNRVEWFPKCLLF